MKLTGPLTRVLSVFLADASAWRYGYDLMKAARLPSGTLYPMLARLQEQGLVTAQWEQHSADAICTCRGTPGQNDGACGPAA